MQSIDELFVVGIGDSMATLIPGEVATAGGKVETFPAVLSEKEARQLVGRLSKEKKLSPSAFRIYVYRLHDVLEG